MAQRQSIALELHPATVGYVGRNHWLPDETSRKKTDSCRMKAAEGQTTGENIQKL
jgi:hypothetical protein